MRAILLAVLAATACGAPRPRPPLPLPVAAPGEVQIAARGFEPAGDVRIVEVAVTSEHPEALTLDRRQVFARVGDPTSGVPGRVAPLTPPEAARLAGSEGLPGAARASAAGAAEGGLRGAATGAVTGGGTGGAIGAAVGAIGGIFRGAQPTPPDVAGFEDRALPATTTLRPGLSATGLVYFPAGDYGSLEVLLVGEHEIVRLAVPIAPPAPEER
ncbi:MAG TPA: hypothetical protein VFD92_24615 [Candidatus Binatia bacterium]|nr:hypothetical protein [Candidatus Binatia bacterium]